MKKIFNSILILFTASIFLVACDKDNFTVLNSNATTTVSLSVTDVVLDKDNAGMEVLSVSWTEPDYGFDAGATYKVNFTYGEKSAAVNVGTDLSKVFENVELNKILLNLGFEGGTASEVVINIQATLSETTNIISNNISLLATVYEDKLDLSTTWGIVGSGYNNWGETPDAPFFKTDDANVIVAYVTLVDGEIKVRENNEWGNDYGDANLDGVLDKDSDNNIAVTAGTYKFTMNISTLAYSIEEFTWGLVGSATVNSWDGPDMPLTYDSYTDTWKAIVTLVDGEIKIRQNNTWGTDYGDADSNGVLDQDSDNNIAVTAGNYLVTVDLNTFEYSLEAIDIWGLVGSAAPNGWDGPNERFTLDFSQDDVWVLNGVTLIDGEIKFRTNDSWDLNYGDATGDGVLDQDDDNNIAVTAGTYNIVLDFSNPSEPVYTITAI